MIDKEKSLSNYEAMYVEMYYEHDVYCIHSANNAVLRTSCVQAVYKLYIRCILYVFIVIVKRDRVPNIVTHPAVGLGDGASNPNSMHQRTSFAGLTLIMIPTNM